MAFKENKQLLNDINYISVLLVISSFFAGVGLVTTFSVTWSSFLSGIVFLFLSVSFLFVDYVLFQKLAQRLKSLKVIIVTQG